MMDTSTIGREGRRHLQWFVALPYPEGGARRIAAELDRRGQLRGLVTPSRRFMRAAVRALEIVHAHSVPDGLRRAASSPHLVIRAATEVAWYIEASRVLRRLPGPARHLLPSFDSLKAVFDSAASRRIPTDADIILGFPGACATTFRTADPSTLKVLYEVDSHPLVHDRLLHHYFPGEQNRRELYIPAYTARILQEIDLADLVVVPSRFVLDQFLAEGVPADKLLILPYGVDTLSFRPVPPKIGLQPDLTRLLYVGSIGARKGVSFLLQAAADLPGIHLDLYGPIIDPALLSDLPANVRWHDVVTHDELKQVFADHDAFVFQSIDDACPLAVREALSAGLPVIASAGVGGVEELPTEDVTVTPIGDVVTLRTAMATAEKLSFEDRMKRAARMRGKNGLLDWRDYSTNFIAAVEATRANGLSGDLDARSATGWKYLSPFARTGDES